MGRILLNTKEKAMDNASALQMMQLFLSFGNVCIMLYAFKKFLSKPHDSLEERVAVLELEQREMKERLIKGNDKFRDQDNTNEVLIHSVLALIEFEMQYCLSEKKPITEELQKAKENLHSYLAKR
jgi:hypothetical protein